MSETGSTTHDPLEGVGPDGMIVTGADAARIPDMYRPVLDAAVREIGSRENVSLYLYGSVATGTAVAPRSDVDLFTIDLPAAEAQRLARVLSARFDQLCRDVDVGAAQATDYDGDDPAAHGNRVFLRHYSVHLSGPDPRADLPDYAADADAARGFNGDLALHAQRWRIALDDGTDAAALRRSIGRKSLFAVAGLVSVHDATWTTDRRRAAERWSEVEPDLADDLHLLRQWGDGEQVASHSRLSRALDGAVTRIIGAFAQAIGLWPSGSHGETGT